MRVCTRSRFDISLIKRLSWFVAAVFALNAQAAKPGNEIVIGQSLPLTGVLFDAAQGVQGGATALIERINASGGIRGKTIRLVTLDDQGDLKLYQENFKRLATEHGAVAVINCMGDDPCRAAAEQAERLHIPLIGALAGTKDLRTGNRRYVFNIRPGYDRESAALATQLQALSVKMVALIAEKGSSREPLAALAAALEKAGIKSRQLLLDDASNAAIEKMLAELKEGRFDATTVFLSLDMVNHLNAGQYGQRSEWPVVATSFANASLTLTAQTLGGRLMFGFSGVVPNPDQLALPLMRTFQSDVERYATPISSTFEGVEGYINASVCVEALRANATALSGESVATALRNLGPLNLEGFRLKFEEGRPNASEQVDIGVMTKGRSFMR